MAVIIASLDEAYALKDKLSPEWIESAQAFSKGRCKTFLGGRALLLKALEEFYGIETLPRMITLEHGKPAFFESRYPFFNISHSSSIICLAVGDYEQGIDVEYLKRRHNLEGLKQRVLCETELSYFDKLRENEQLQLFTSLWTLRECLIKTSGRGLVDISSISVDISNSTLRYFSIPKNLTFRTIRLDTVLASEKDSYLTCCTGTGDSLEVYLLNGTELVKVPNINLTHTYISV